MTYRAMGAGPGPVKTYKIDAPFPWGSDTEITLPVDAMVADTWTALQPRLDALETKLVQDMEMEMDIYAPQLIKELMDEVVRPEISKQMEIGFAQVGLIENDALKAALAIAGMVMLSVGIAAYWVKSS